jgi:hypothetical protein
MPKQQAARERAQATVDAAAASAQPSPAATNRERSILLRIAPERWKALEAIAQGRSLDAVVADLIDEHLRKNGIPR